MPCAGKKEDYNMVPEWLRYVCLVGEVWFIGESLVYVFKKAEFKSDCWWGWMTALVGWSCLLMSDIAALIK